MNAVEWFAGLMMVVGAAILILAHYRIAVPPEPCHEPQNGSSTHQAIEPR